jgi:hypothetical protein
MTLFPSSSSSYDEIAFHAELTTYHLHLLSVVHRSNGQANEKEKKTLGGKRRRRRSKEPISISTSCDFYLTGQAF